MNLLIISGPTATGKTDLAAHIAKEFNGELISADSRQVYIGMDIVTGKDRPEGVILHGIDLVNPDQDFDISHFATYAHHKIKEISDQGNLPILVGGTGFYINAIIRPPETIGIPIDQKLRQELDQLTVEQLQIKLKQLDPDKLSRMNNSDINNPRRLVRAIEVANQNQTLRGHNTPEAPQYNYFHIHLTTDLTNIESKIKARVLKRLDQGAIEETQNLLNQYSQNCSSMSALGYQEIIRFLNNQITQEKLIDLWSLHEVQYAKRQLTWFQKQPNLTTISAQNQNYIDISIETVRKWLYAKN